MTGKLMDWEAAYRDHGIFGGLPPWNIGEPQPEIAALLRAGGIRSEVLDAGCGIAELSLALAAQGHTVVGIDIAGSAIAKAKQAANDRGFSTASFVQDDLTSLRGYDRRFNTIIDSTVFESLPVEMRDHYLRSLHRAAAPGAMYYVLVSTASALPKNIALPPDAPAVPPNVVTEQELREAVSEYWKVDKIRPAFIHAHPVLAKALSQIPGVLMDDYEVDEKNRLKLPAFLLTAHKAA
ncbi:class I SAM-dependent methyltransferase [Mycobacterium gastri]|uniref:SAM-dependent methyltransferase n=1 Tax=Mycobacterium gastri TaxID=1777 RepID=A0A1X1V4W1_MYCGS|nr:class I SAM-dependent methyltransferase [Mycobacterium gastri]ETW25020.1 SAM-dependent methlyltransferase [Mycobacterium gastri 'Wayne']ORV64115.1 SAM-dependent methyltransferase [Mycobacterium gastri]